MFYCSRLHLNCTSSNSTVFRINPNTVNTINIEELYNLDHGVVSRQNTGIFLSLYSKHDWQVTSFHLSVSLGALIIRQKAPAWNCLASKWTIILVLLFKGEKIGHYRPVVHECLASNLCARYLSCGGEQFYDMLRSLFDALILNYMNCGANKEFAISRKWSTKLPHPRNVRGRLPNGQYDWIHQLFPFFEVEYWQKISMIHMRLCLDGRWVTEHVFIPTFALSVCMLYSFGYVLLVFNAQQQVNEVRKPVVYNNTTTYCCAFHDFR